MAHLTLQEVLDRVNHNYFYYSSKQLRGARNWVESRPHHPEYYVPRITRFLAGFMFGAFRAASHATTVQDARGPYSVLS
jgi:hypothetical protein